MERKFKSSHLHNNRQFLYVTGITDTFKKNRHATGSIDLGKLVHFWDIQALNAGHEWFPLSGNLGCVIPTY